MKKLKFHIFSGKTGKVKSKQIPLWKPIFWIVAALVAICGFVFFSPLQIWEKVSDGTLVDLRAQNRSIRQNIKTLKENNDSAENYLTRTANHQDSVYKIGGIPLPTSSDSSDSVYRQERTEALFQTYKTYSAFRKALNDNKNLAEAIPVLRPLKKKTYITNRFGIVFDHFTDQELPHRGVDFFAEEGDTVIAPGAGKVIEIRAHRGFGQTLKIQHSDRIRTFYAHLDWVLVKQGETVRRGEPIAIAGRSGRTAGSVLHYEIRMDGEPINPEDYFIER